MVMFRAKTEVSTNFDITRRARKVPPIETIPTSSGIDAATTPRKTIRSSRASSGKAISSARIRSVRTVSLTSLNPAARPPTVTLNFAGPQSCRGLVRGMGEDLHVAAREVGGQEEGPAVGGDQLRRSPGERVFDPGDSVERAQGDGEALHLSPQGRGMERQARLARRLRPDAQQDPGETVAARLLDQEGLLSLALACRVAEAGCLEVLLDVIAEDEGGDGEDRDRDEDLASDASRSDRRSSRTRQVYCS